MAFDTYAGLLAELQNWCWGNADLPYASFVTMAEARFNRELRTQDMEQTSTVTTDETIIEVPDDWLETIAFARQTSTGLQVMDSNSIVQEQLMRYATGEPVSYNHMDGGIRVSPPPNGEFTYELVYYKKIPPLTSVDPNWLLTKSPDLYVYGSLVQSAPYLMDDQRMTLWEAKTVSIIEGMNNESRRAEHARGQGPVRRVTFG